MTALILMPIADARGGAEMLLRALLQHGREAQGRREAGVRWVVVFFEAGPMVDGVTAMGVSTHVVPAGRLREGRRWWATVRAITDIARLESADLVVSWMAKAHLYGAVAARRAGVPAVWYQHGIPSPREPMDRLATALPARAVLACSKTAAAAQRRLWPRRPTEVAYPCVDLSRYDPERLPTPAEARHRLGLPASGPLIGTVGRLQRWKGMHTLLEAMPAILRQHPDAHCVIVGGRHDAEADYERELVEGVRALGLAGHVTLAGFQEDVPLWMQAMDVFVHAADREPFGMVVVEAMALGKPVVAGAAGGPSEVISEGENGLLAPFGGGELLAGHVLRYLNAPAWAAEIGRSGRMRAGAFSATAYAERLVETLGRCVCGLHGESGGGEEGVTAYSHLEIPL